MDKDAKFESKDALQTWLRSRGIDEENADAAAAKLFTEGFKNQSTLLGISSDLLLRVGLNVPLAMELSNKLQPSQQNQQIIAAETLPTLGVAVNGYRLQQQPAPAPRIDLVQVILSYAPF